MSRPVPLRLEPQSPTAVHASQSARRLIRASLESHEIGSVDELHTVLREVLNEGLRGLSTNEAKFLEAGEYLGALLLSMVAVVERLAALPAAEAGASGLEQQLAAADGIDKVLTYLEEQGLTF